MNKRIFIIGGVILAAAAIVVALVLMLGGGPQEPDPDPTGGTGGTVTLPDGTQAGSGGSTGVNVPEPEGSRNPDGTLEMSDPHAVDGQTHPETEAECDTGPYTVACEGEDEYYEMPAPETMTAASNASKAFAEAWLTITAGEDAAARTARLTAAGASPAVAAQVPALTRPETSLTNLTTESVPYGPMYAAFTRVQGGDIVFVVSVKAFATYTVIDRKQEWQMPGTMFISVNPTTYQVTAVSETYPNLSGMS